MRNLVLAALWMDTPTADEATSEVAHRLAGLKAEGTGAAVVAFTREHEQIPALLRDLRRFQLQELGE